MERLDSDGLLKLLQSMASGSAQIPALTESQLRVFLALAAVSVVSALEAMEPSPAFLATLAKLAEDESITAAEAVEEQQAHAEL